MGRKRGSVTFGQIIDLIDSNRDSQIEVLICDNDENRWNRVFTDSTMLNGIDDRLVNSIGVEDGMICIWLDDDKYAGRYIESTEIRDRGCKGIREIRRAHNITQKELADAIGVSETIVSRYEKGVVTPPTNRLKLIADYFQVSVDQLIDNNS